MKDKRVTWFCGRWVGHGDVLNKATDADRRNPNVAVPPFETCEWVNKPSEMRAATVHTDDEALTWLADQLDHFAPRLAPGEAERYREYLPNVRHRLGLRRNITWQFWLSDKATCVALSLVTPDAR